MRKKSMVSFLLSVALGIGSFSMQTVTSGLVPGRDLQDSAVTAQAASMPSATTLAKAVKKAYGDNYAPNYKLSKEEIEVKYGVASSLYSSAYAEVPMISANVDQLVVFKAKNKSSKKKILSSIKKYQADLKEDTMQYPMNRLKIQGSKVYANGNYVCFFMLGQIDRSIEESDSDEEIIKAYQKQNKKAVNTVKKKLKK